MLRPTSRRFILIAACIVLLSLAVISACKSLDTRISDDLALSVEGRVTNPQILLRTHSLHELSVAGMTAIWRADEREDFSGNLVLRKLAINSGKRPETALEQVSGLEFWQSNGERTIGSACSGIEDLSRPIHVDSKRSFFDVDSNGIGADLTRSIWGNHAVWCLSDIVVGQDHSFYGIGPEGLIRGDLGRGGVVVVPEADFGSLRNPSSNRRTCMS